MSQLYIYKASAGAGKTFRLAYEYFRLIFKDYNQSEFRHILAVTFTNKATEEMKFRIIHELHRLAEGEKSDYGRMLQEEFGFSDDELRNRAQKLRTMLLHDYGRISITTIDRFFQRTLKAFTKELGIFSGYNVELDSDYVLDEAVDKLLAEANDDEDLLEWIGEFIQQNIEDERNWNVSSQIKTLGQELFKEVYLQLDQEERNILGDKSFLKAYRNLLTKIKSEYEQEMTGLATEARKLVDGAGVNAKTFMAGVCYWDKVLTGNFAEGIGSNARKAADDPMKLTSKANQKYVGGIATELSSILRQFISKVDGVAFRKYYSATVILKNIYQIGILGDLSKRVRDYCEENGVMLLNDTTQILNRLIDNNDTTFLYEKTGNYYKHLMMDEFQDTSSMQWKNFRPLVVNSLGEGNFSLIVGDVKQSIYRWRNGDWTLLAQGVEEEMKAFTPNNVFMKDNWRSAREVVEFNNILFHNSAIYLKELFDGECGEGAERWSADIDKAYADVEQIVRSKATGYVDVRFGESKKSEEGSDEAILEDVVSIFDDIRMRGGRLRDSVILVRNKKEGALVANYLMAYNELHEDGKVPFISNESLFVSSSPYVQFLTAILNYLVEPFNAVNRATAYYLYCAYIAHNVEDIHNTFVSTSADAFKEWFDGKLAGGVDLLSCSLFETVEVLIDRFGLGKNRDEVQYVLAFQELVFGYESQSSNNIPLFLEWWDKEKGRASIITSEDVDAVRIMTIHASKGLEFDFVVLPFCNWKLDTTNPSRQIWCEDPSTESPIHHIPLEYSTKLLQTMFAESYYDEHLKAYVDNMNLLYVALTRAKTELYIRSYAPEYSKDGLPKNIGTFIHSVLTNLTGVSFQVTEEGNVAYGTKQQVERKSTEQLNTRTLMEYPVYMLGDRIKVRYSYEDYTNPENDTLSAIDEGKLLHEIFCSIETKEDIDKAVNAVYLGGLIDYEEVKSYLKEVRVYLSQEEVQSWYTGDWEVINERDILLHNTEKLSKARPDRVMIRGKEAVVIDYKFGVTEEERYKRQVSFYCGILKQMGYKVSGYLWYVRGGKVEQVV